MQLVEPEVAALVGALVWLDHQGALKIERNRLQTADVVTAKRATANVAGAAGSASKGGGAIVGVSDRLCHQMMVHQSRALQALRSSAPCTSQMPSNRSSRLSLASVAKIEKSLCRSQIGACS